MFPVPIAINLSKKNCNYRWWHHRPKILDPPLFTKEMLLDFLVFSVLCSLVAFRDIMHFGVLHQFRCLTPQIITYQTWRYLTGQSNLLLSLLGGCHIKCYVNDSAIYDWLFSFILKDDKRLKVSIGHTHIMTPVSSQHAS
jgi:hypothetical protein